MWTMTAKGELLNLNHVKTIEMKDLATSKDDPEKWCIIANCQDRYHILQAFDSKEACKTTFENRAFQLCNEGRENY